MPIYVYECNACTQQIEVQQSIKDAPLTDCDKCGSKGSLMKLIQPTAVLFKGSGFHINDYASSSNKVETSSNTEAKASSESSSTASTATESKPSTESKAAKDSTSAAAPS